MIMIKLTINYLEAVKNNIFYCDKFCNNLSKRLKAVNNDAPSADTIKNKLKNLYELGESGVIDDLSTSKNDKIIIMAGSTRHTSYYDNELSDYSIESNDSLNLKIIFFANEKTKELIDLKVVFKS